MNQGTMWRGGVFQCVHVCVCVKVSEILYLFECFCVNKTGTEFMRLRICINVCVKNKKPCGFKIQWAQVIEN